MVGRLKVTAKSYNARFKRLLEAGYFAPEQPPFFTSRMFAKKRQNLMNDFSSLPTIKGDPNYYRYKCEHSYFMFPRYKHRDRRHAVMNPVSFFFLSHHIAKNFVTLRKKSKASVISVSAPAFDWVGERAIMRPNYDARDKFLMSSIASSEYLLQTDIQAFYHSVYTHAIAWAIEGKTFAKANKSLALLGNLIDLLCRNSQDGQTIGLPVGPDTSRILAEIVISAVDSGLNINTKAESGIRFVDDYLVAFSSQSEAETLAAQLRRRATEFELDINSSKTIISPTRAMQFNGWKSAVKRLIPKPPFTADDVEFFLYEVERICRDHPEINVHKFALRNARLMLINYHDWTFIQTHLISLYRQNPTLIQEVVEIILIRKQVSNDLDLRQLSAFINSLIPTLINQMRLGELSRILFLAIGCNVPVKAQSLEGIKVDFDCFTLTQIAYLQKKSLIDGSFDFSPWSTYLSTPVLNTGMWLFAYETAFHGMGGSSGDTHVRNHPYFSKLLTNRVSFLNFSNEYYNLTKLLQQRAGMNAIRSAIQQMDDDDVFASDGFDIEQEHDPNQEDDYF